MQKWTDGPGNGRVLRPARVLASYMDPVSGADPDLVYSYLLLEVIIDEEVYRRPAFILSEGLMEILLNLVFRNYSASLCKAELCILPVSDLPY
jgi:hypothetical protein